MSILEQQTSRSVRWYRVLLRVYPHEFRAHYEVPMCQAFADQSQREAQSSGRLRRLLFWLRTLWDLMLSAARQRFGTSSLNQVSWRWILACGAALPLAIVDERYYYRFHLIYMYFAMFGQLGLPLAITRSATVYVVGVGLLLGVLQALSLGGKWSWRFLWLLATINGAIC